MAEYIEKARLLERLTDYYNCTAMDDTKPLSMRTAADCLSIIGGAPAADVVEVRHGEWVEAQEPLGWCDVDCAECSVCHESWIIDEDSSIDDCECMWHYCPHCGAKMDGGTNDDSKKSVRASE